MHTLGHYLYKARKALTALLVSSVFPYRQSRIADQRWEREYTTGHWDYLRTLEQAARYQVIAGYVQHFAPGGSVLDVGCGDGHLQEILARAGYERYLGLDLSSEAIRRAASRGDERTDFRQVEVDELETDERFDVVVFNEVLYYLAAPMEVLDRYERFLTPEGIFVASIHGARPWNRRLWKMIARRYPTLDQVEVSHGSGKFWTIKVLSPKERADGPSQGT
jgi:2-polyprenyl-3-methyl-5-hydroxy-6-metoxy-1,4-benzoquinol methylase